LCTQPSGDTLQEAMNTTISRLDTRELRAWRGLLRVHAQLSKALDAQLEAAHGLPLTSYEVLMYLSDAEGGRMRMNDLAASVLLSRSGLTRLVDRLEREGYLERCSCAHDARGAFAVLTQAGREKLDATRETHLAGVRELFLGHFTPEELDMLGDAWERVLKA
jgi:DNA-binding MarR family transcriptional regulator